MVYVQKEEKRDKNKPQFVRLSPSGGLKTDT